MVNAITTSDVQTYALVAIVVFLVIAVAAALVIRAIVGKVIAAAIMVALAVVVWGQRASIKSCADDVKAAAQTPGGPTKTTCRFFGRDIDVKLPGR